MDKTPITSLIDILHTLLHHRLSLVTMLCEVLELEESTLISPESTMCPVRLRPVHAVLSWAQISLYNVCQCIIGL